MRRQTRPGASPGHGVNRNSVHPPIRQPCLLVLFLLVSRLRVESLEVVLGCRRKVFVISRIRAPNLKFCISTQVTSCITQLSCKEYLKHLLWGCLSSTAEGWALVLLTVLLLACVNCHQVLALSLLGPQPLLILVVKISG